MRLASFATVLLFAVSAAAAAPSFAQSPAPAASTTAKYSTTGTEIGVLLDDPAAKAILVKHIPELATSDQIDMVRSMTLKAVQDLAPDKISDKALNDIDADLAKLPAKK